MYAYVVRIQCSLQVQRLTHAGDWSLLSLALDIALKAAGFISQPANNILARKSTVPQTKSGCGMVLNKVETNWAYLHSLTTSLLTTSHNLHRERKGLVVLQPSSFCHDQWDLYSSWIAFVVMTVYLVDVSILLPNKKLRRNTKLWIDFGWPKLVR